MTTTALRESASPALQYGLIHLTPNERKVFDCLYGALGCWLRQREVSVALMGYDYAPTTFKTYVCRLRQKLAGSDWSVEGKGTDVLRLVKVPPQ